MKRYLTRALTVSTVVTLALLAGCSSRSDDSNASDDTDKSDNSITAKAEEMVAGFTAVQTNYPDPGEAYDPGTGTAAVLACGFAAPVCKEQADFAVEAITAMGWDTDPAFDGQFSPQVQSGFVDRAIQQDLDGVILVSIDVNTIKESVERAVEEGLTVTCVMCASGDEWAGKLYDVTVDWEQQGSIAAWAILASTGDQAKVVAFRDEAYPSTVLRSQGLEATLSSECSECTFDGKTFASADISKPGPPQVSALLASEPKGEITNLVGHYDGFGMAAANTVKQAGRTEIAVSGYDGSPEAVKAIIDGTPAPYAFSVSEPYTYAEWAAADILGRTKAGLPIWEGYDNLPSTLINASNASDYLTEMPSPEGDWKAAWELVWSAN